ncbi:carbohydrate esterase family 1 protein [Patellaria atrata CBS 101060]|uniref:Carboxylic ester hydrolase n=1 Tax=Patellaria atrata CBS 101060 TaxID=1346257 RepID=A0A9P4VQI8_9PEZI|nr:carbohydrate esterase family 1 protein [Patellaria atrata CBS 101060]
MASSSFLRSLLAVFALVSAAWAASLTQVTNWGSNPSNIGMWIYVPNNVAPNPAVVLALHYCGGSAQAYYTSTKLPSLADQKGFIIIYPGTTKDNNCWDVASAKSLARNGGGDSQGLAAMVQYTIQKYTADPAKVFVLGTSSGGMMTSVMLATYPDLFSAGAVFSGVGYGCLAGSPGASPQTADPKCANGQVVKSATEWGNMVRSAYPAFNGTRPKVQLWHGEADNFVSYKNLAEMVKQWTDVLGVSFQRNVTNTPLSGYTKMVFGDDTRLQAYSARGVGHVVPVHEPSVMTWFGL